MTTMNVLSFDEVVEAAQHLRPEEIQALFERIQTPAPEAVGSVVPTTDEEYDDLRAVNESLNAAGAFEGDERLFVIPATYFHTITDAELLAAIEDISCEWDAEAEQLV
ncbi:MAG: hypothetical protein IPK16_02835 [Anaerolineales bacterium]|nr:hypothetical protein [Anaerolineales bacterium]